MNIAVLLENIDRRLKAVKMTAHAASLEAGYPELIRNLKRGKSQSIKAGALQALAKVLKTTTDDLTRETLPPATLPATDQDEYRLMVQRQLEFWQGQMDMLDAAAAKKPRKTATRR